eukprot:5568058-Pyramimonas_sp.AAC.1
MAKPHGGYTQTVAVKAAGASGKPSFQCVRRCVSASSSASAVLSAPRPRIGTSGSGVRVFDMWCPIRGPCACVGGSGLS